MTYMYSERDTPYLYSGWEPHNVVRDAKFVNDKFNKNVHCQVLGREPITSTAIYLVGEIIEYRHELYDRGYTLKTPDGSIYKVGGTNTTSSIAAFLTILSLPNAFNPPQLKSWNEVSHYISQVTECYSQSDFEAGQRILTYFEKWIRLDLLPNKLGKTIAQSIPGGRELLEHFTEERAKHFPENQHDNNYWSSLINELLIFNNPIICAEICSLLALLPGEKSFQYLINALSHDSSLITRAASLSLRSMEYEVQKLSSHQPHTTSLLLEKISNTLLSSGDPDTRVYIAESLGYFGMDDENVLKTLVHKLAYDEEDHVRWASTVALGRRSIPDIAIELLLQRLNDEKYIRARRSCLLSLGRLLQRVDEDPLGFSKQVINEQNVITIVLKSLQSNDIGEKTYAAYCLGELRTVTVHVVDALLDMLSLECAFSLRAHITLALWKLISRDTLSDNQLKILRVALNKSLNVETLKHHPDASYQEWFSLTSLRILASLDEHFLAANFAGKCSHTYRIYPGRSSYFQGLAKSFLAETFLSKGMVRDAINLLTSAEDLFRTSASTPTALVPGDLGDNARVGALTRARLVNARRLFLHGVMLNSNLSIQNPSDRTVHDYSEKLSKAQQSLDLVIRSAEQIYNSEYLPGRLRSRFRAIEKIELHREIVLIAIQLDKLRASLSVEKDANEVLRNFELLVGVLENRGSVLNLNEYPLIYNIWQEMNSIASDSHNAIVNKNRSLHIEATRVLTRITKLLLSPMPVPDVDHRLLGEGRAFIGLTAIYGATIAENSENLWLIPSGSKYPLIQMSINVQIRSEDEDLILNYNNSEGFQGIFRIHIYEGMEKIEISVPEWISGDFNINFELKFVHGLIDELVDSTYLVLRRLKEESNSFSTINLIKELDKIQEDKFVFEEKIKNLKENGMHDLVHDLSKKLSLLEEKERKLSEQLSLQVSGKKSAV